MSSFGRAVFVLSLLMAAPALAQGGPPSGAPAGPQNLDAGKSVAQMFNSDCSICHKSPQGLAKGGGLLGLESFLRSHYTASRESAAALAAYLRAAGDPPAAAARGRPKQPPKGEAKKPGDAKTSAKPEDGKPADAKPADAKPAETKPAETKTAEPKPVEAKPAETKPAESKPADTKPADSKSD